MYIRQCGVCIHHLGSNSCKAFPNHNIPSDILGNHFIHNKPYPDDNGIQFEPDEDAEFFGYDDINSVKPRLSYKDFD